MKTFNWTTINSKLYNSGWSTKELGDLLGYIVETKG